MCWRGDGIKKTEHLSYPEDLSLLLESRKCIDPWDEWTEEFFCRDGNLWNQLNRDFRTKEMELMKGDTNWREWTFLLFGNLKSHQVHAQCIKNIFYARMIYYFICEVYFLYYQCLNIMLLFDVQGLVSELGHEVWACSLSS